MHTLTVFPLSRLYKMYEYDFNKGELPPALTRRHGQ